MSTSECHKIGYYSPNKIFGCFSRSKRVVRADRESKEIYKNRQDIKRINFRATTIMTDLILSITGKVNELGSKSKLYIYHQYS